MVRLAEALIIVPAIASALTERHDVVNKSSGDSIAGGLAVDAERILRKIHFPIPSPPTTIATLRS